MKRRIARALCAQLGLPADELESGATVYRQGMASPGLANNCSGNGCFTTWLTAVSTPRDRAKLVTKAGPWMQSRTARGTSALGE